MSTPSTTPRMLAAPVVIVGLEVDAVEADVGDVATADGHLAGDRRDAVARGALDVRVVDHDTGRWEVLSRIVADVDAITACVAGDRIVQGDVGAAIDLDAVLAIPWFPRAHT